MRRARVLGALYAAAVLVALALACQGALSAGAYAGALLGPLVNTLWVTFFSLLLVGAVGFPAGVFAAFGQGAGARLFQVATDGLSATPSVVVGLFALAVLVRGAHLGFSLLAGGLALGLFNLPVGVRLVAEALSSAPSAWVEGSFALGADRAQTLWRVMVPGVRPALAAVAGEVAARSVGESALLYLTAGVSDHGLAFQPLVGGATLSVKLYYYLTQGQLSPASPAGAVCFALVIMGLGLETASLWLRGHF